MDQIIIEELQVYAHHGVYREENEKGQNFYINAVLGMDTRNAGILDDLDLSTNYGEVCTFLSGYVKEHTYKLIETVAEKSAEALLLRFPLVRSVTLEVRKPEAPIPLSFRSVSVKITRGWRRAYLSCGSNMGDRGAHLDGAVEALRGDEKCRILRVSDWIVTKPYGGVEQDDFLNGAIALETLYTPGELLERLHEIECAHDRERRIHWGPRTLDLDILLYEDCVMHTDDLIIPHVDMHNRYFVLRPLAQIAPYERHPLSGQSIGQMYEALKKGEGEGQSDTPQIRVEKASLETARAIYETYLRADFPPEEVKPFAVIERMWKKNSYAVYAFYENDGNHVSCEKSGEHEDSVNREKSEEHEDSENCDNSKNYGNCRNAENGRGEQNCRDAENGGGGQNCRGAKGTLCAYAFLLADNKERVLLLDYFAVCARKRGAGYGSHALSLLREACGEWKELLIEVEDDELPDIDGEMRRTRKRRISFYAKAGCRLTSARSRLWGVDYRIMYMPLSGIDAGERITEKLESLYMGMHSEREWNVQTHFEILST